MARTGRSGAAPPVAPPTRPPVTRREHDVLDALRDQLTNAEIAERLYISERTVESHVSSLLRKLGAASRRELGRLASGTDALDGASAASSESELPPPLERAATASRLLGRREALQELRAAWDAARSRLPTIVLVTGEAGIGKSRLAAELAVEVHRSGSRVLYGECLEEAPAPYQPFAQALERHVDDLRGAVHGRAGRVLARILPPVGPLDARPASGILDGPGERAEILTAIERAIVGSTPTLIVVEDLHWATKTTGDTLRHLTRPADRAQLLVVATTRDVPPDLDDQLSVLLADLARSPSVRRLALRGLDAGSIAMLADEMGAGEAVSISAIHQDTGGNPLLVREAIAGLTPNGGGAGPVRDLLTRRYERLSQTATAVVDLGAVLGAEFDVNLLAAASGRGVPNVVAALEEAEAAGLLAAVPGRPGRFAFVHALFRSSRYAELPGAVRLRLHDQVARELARRAPSAPDAIGDLARHAHAAIPLYDARAAVEHASAAADEATRALAFEVAVQHYQRALELTAVLDPPDPVLRVRLLAKAGEVLQHAGHTDARKTLEEAAREAGRLQDADVLADVAWAMTPYGQTVVGRFDETLVSLVEAALGAHAPRPAAKARLLAVLASQYGATSARAHRRHELIGAALRAAREADDLWTLAQVLIVSQWAGYDPDNLVRRLGLAGELASLGRALDHPILESFGLGGRWWTLVERGDLAEARPAGHAYETASKELPMAVPALGVGVYRTTRHYLAGDLEAAEASADAHQELAAAAGLAPLDYYAPHLMTIRFNQGRIGELVDVIETAAAANTDAVAYRAVRALALARTGRAAEARGVLAELGADDFATVPRDFFWLSAMVSLADTAAVVGDREAASRLRAQLTPYAGRLAVFGIGVSHPVDLALAQVALTLGDADAARQAAQSAAAAARRNKTPVFLSRALVLEVAALQRNDREAAIAPLLDEAIAIADRRGAGIIQDDIARLGLL